MTDYHAAPDGWETVSHADVSPVVGSYDEKAKRYSAPDGWEEVQQEKPGVISSAIGGLGVGVVALALWTYVDFQKGFVERWMPP